MALLFLGVHLLLIVATPTASAQHTPAGHTPSDTTTQGGHTPSDTTNNGSGVGAEIGGGLGAQGDPSGDTQGTCTEPDVTKDNCSIVEYLRIFINVLSGIVGIVIVIMIAIGGIQYSTARDNPQGTAAAKNRIMNAILALVVYLFAFAILQWLVPGGIF